MRKWLSVACVAVATGLAFSAVAETGKEATAGGDKAAGPRAGTVVEIKPNRLVLMGITLAGNRLVAVGERGFVLLSDDAGDSWRAVGTPVTRTLTAVAFNGDKMGVAVGHGGSLVRTEDGGDTWIEVPMDEAFGESLLGVTALGDGRFAAYGAFGMYFDTSDGGQTWTRRTVMSEDFDRHISEVVLGRHGLLGMVGESGTLATSEDGGMTWIRTESPYPGSYFGALQADDDSWLAYGMRGSVYRSTDRGATWEKIEIGTTTSLNGGCVRSDGRIVLVGNAGLVVESSDNMQSVEVRWSPESRGFSDVVEVQGKLVVVGEGGVEVLDTAALVKK